MAGTAIAADVASTDDGPPGAEPRAEQEAEECRGKEAAFVRVDLPDVHQEEQGNAERADGDQRGAGAGEGEDQQEHQKEGEGDTERGLGPVREMGKERRHHGEAEDRLIGEGGVRVQPLRGALAAVDEVRAAGAAEPRVGDDHLAVRTRHRRQDRKVHGG